MIPSRHWQIPTVSDSDKHILETKIQLALKPEKRAPAVISISVVKAPTEAYRVVSELKATLGRAMSRRTTGWHGERAVEMKAADCAAIAASADSNCARTLGPRHKWPKTLRFIVERPSGSSFSDELAAALKEAGFLVVPDPRFENTDTCGWLASRNSDHLHEIRQFMNSARNDAADPESEDWGDRVDRAIDEKIRRLGDVYSHECDWKWFDPEAHAAEIRRCLGFRVRWEHFDEYRAGSYRFRLTVPA